MTVLYQDPLVVLDDDAITIHMYYFPMGSKRIPYTDLRSFKVLEMGLLTGKLRLWGSSTFSHWLHLDLKRPWKSKGIMLDTGNLFRPVITPDDPSKVVEILARKTGHGSAVA